MNQRLRLVFFGFGSLVLPIASTAVAQNPPPVSSAAPADDAALSQTLTELETIGTDLGKKLAALQKLVDEEAAANRLTEAAAKSIRLSLLGSTSSPGTGYNGTLISTRVPADNTALLNATKSFESDWGLAQVQRATLSKKATDEIRLRILAATRSASTVAEIDSLIALAERLQQAVPSRNFSSSALGPNYVAAYPNFLRALRRVVELQTASPLDPVAIGESLYKLRNLASSSQIEIDETNLLPRIQATAGSFLKAQDAAQENLERLLLAGKSSAEMLGGLATLEQAAEQYQQVQTSGRKRDISNQIGIYRSLASGFSTLEAGQFTRAKNTFSNLRSNLRSLGATNTVTFARLLDQWEKLADEGIAKTNAKRLEELRTRLAALKRPSDLETLSSELYKVESDTQEREPSFPRGLAAQLSVLAAAWSTNNSGLMRQSYVESVDPRLTADLAELRRRIERDIFTTNVRVPELNQPPFAEKPLDEAIEAFTTQLAQKGEWRRILQIVEPRMNQSRMDGTNVRDGDLVAALRAYFTAQNLELAEQWADAIQSYKAVLTSISERAPIKEAAARVKELSTAHPDAVKPPAPATPPASVPLAPRTR